MQTAEQLQYTERLDAHHATMHSRTESQAAIASLTRSYVDAMTPLLADSLDYHYSRGLDRRAAQTAMQEEVAEILERIRQKLTINPILAHRNR